MNKNIITPVEHYDDIWIKRDDLAYADPDGACGSKVRQYMAMMAANPGSPLVVGCSAVSCQQVYIGDAVRRTGRKGYVIVPQRKVWSAATQWTAAQGVEIIEVPPPAWRTVYMARAKEYARQLGSYVRWDQMLAVEDTATQCVNIPSDVKRVVVPTGSGLTAAGSLEGLRATSRTIPVLAVAVSTLATPTGILKHTRSQLLTSQLQFLKLDDPYEKPALAWLPDGTLLDPYYAAKVWPLVQPGDLFWVTGCRPLAAMPFEAAKIRQK